MKFCDSLVGHFHHHRVIILAVHFCSLAHTTEWSTNTNNFPDLVWQVQSNREHGYLQVKCTTPADIWFPRQSPDSVPVESLRRMWHFKVGFTFCRYLAHNCLELAKGTARASWFLVLQHPTWSYLASLALDLSLCKVQTIQWWPMHLTKNGPFLLQLCRSTELFHFSAMGSCKDSHPRVFLMYFSTSEHEVVLRPDSRT